MTALSASAEMPGFRMPEGVASFMRTGDYSTNVGQSLEPAGLRATLKRLPEQEFLLLADRFRTVGGSAIACLVVREDLAYRREESANGLYFGQMVINDTVPGEHTELVAVKPLPRPADVAYEFGATNYINGLDDGQGRPLSFVPLGFYKELDGKTSLITRYDHPVRTMDTVFWNPDTQPTDLEAMQALQYCAASLGFLHANRVTHGDAQVKNMAIDGEGVRYVDLTDIKVAKADEEPSDLVSRMSDDVSKLLGSLNARTDSESPPDYRQAISAGFAAEYAAFLADSDLPTEAKLSHDDVMRLAD